MPAQRKAPSEPTWGVGAVAERLGIAAPTLRTWERRYDIGPTFRTDGGHRRYTSDDIERVDYMRRLLDRGVTPREAAKVAHELDPLELAAVMAGEQPGDAALEPEQIVAAVLAAVQDVDPSRLSSLFGGALRRQGVVGAWETVLAPSLIAIGEGWSQGTIGIVSEHVASERLLSELRLHARSHAVPVSRGGVVLTSAEDDQHSLPVFALEAALAEQGQGSFVMGARLPWESLADLAQRVVPDAIFIWATLERRAERSFSSAIESLPPETRLIVGGPGWGSLPVAGAQRAHDFAEALAMIAGDPSIP